MTHALFFFCRRIIIKDTGRPESLAQGEFISMLYSVFQSIASGQGVNMSTVIAQILASLLVIFLILPFHEFAQIGRASCRERV